MSNVYSLALATPPISHSDAEVTFLFDRARPRDPKLDAYVRSGDYFILLSTMLENLAADLPETSVVATSLALSRLADELLYIQKHYQIVPKQQPDAPGELS